MERASLLRAIRIWLVVVAALHPVFSMSGQQTRPSLGSVIQALQANLDHYDADVPSFFCDERVMSARMKPRERDDRTTTDSVFRLKRTAQPDGTTALVESREIKRVNGRVPTSDTVSVPTMLTGIFEGGLAVVSAGQASCMNYKLERPKRPGEIVVKFATQLTPSNTEDCFLQEKSNGRAVVDAASMQVKHLEIVTPKHEIDEGYPGRRELTVEYAPVVLGTETFWMPSTVGMRTTSGSSFDMTTWTFAATYRNCHRTGGDVADSQPAGLRGKHLTEYPFPRGDSVDWGDG